MQDRIKELINKGLKTLKEGNFQLALQYFKEAHELAKESGNIELEVRCYMLIQSAEKAYLLEKRRKTIIKRKGEDLAYGEGEMVGIGDDETILENIIEEQKASEYAASELFDLLGDASGMMPSTEKEQKRVEDYKQRLKEEREKLRKEREKAEEKKEEVIKEPPLHEITPTYPDTSTSPPPPPAAGPPAGPPQRPPSMGPPKFRKKEPLRKPSVALPEKEQPTPSEGPPSPKKLYSPPDAELAPPMPPLPPPMGEARPIPTISKEKSPETIAEDKTKIVEKETEAIGYGGGIGNGDEFAEEEEAPPDRMVRGNGDEGEEEEEVSPSKIKRYGDVSAPMEMTIKKEYLVNIGLRVFKEDVIGMPVPMEVTVPKVGPPIIEVFVIGQDFKVDQPRRTLIVPLDTDSDILNFRVTPKKEGFKNLTVEFYQEGMLIGRAILKIIVKKKKEVVNEALSSTSVTVASQFHDSRLDATLRIVRYEDEFFFSLFTPRAKAVISQSALFGKSSVNIPKLHKLEDLMEKAIFDRRNPRAAVNRLKNLGAQIYNYIPKQIQKTIKSIEPKYLMIETGDLLVPWELAYDGEDFLCSKYCIGKRVFDETRDFRPPPFCIGKKILDVIFIGASPEGWPEISVKDELELFNVYEKTKRIQLQELVEPNAIKAKVLKSLKDGDLVHFTCHGHFIEQKPMESAIKLSDDILTADEIDDIEMSNWPLIFANACSTGAISDKIVGIGGIARAFLEAGAIAFLGPIFEIPDDIAVEFAKEFYNNILYNNENLGEAIFNTRKKLRDQFGGAFWAIFSLYGDPTLNLCKA